MNKPLCTSATFALGACLSVLALDANAIPIHTFSLQAATGQTSYTYNWVLGDPVAESLTLSGWELDSNAWTPATMLYKNQSPGETGLGVHCNTHPQGNSCGQSEIGTTPWQIIDVNLGDVSGYNTLSVGAGSVNTDNSNTGHETAYLYGATCTPDGGCTPTLLDWYTFPGGSYPSDVVSWNFSLNSLLSTGYSNLWLTPNAWGSTPDNNGNILLWGGPNGDAFSVSVVPEPAELGLFGLGILMIGVLTRARRRRR